MALFTIRQSHEFYLA